MKIEDIKNALAKATPEELNELRNLFWDREFEHDVASGRIDAAFSAIEGEGLDVRAMPPKEAISKGLEAG